MHSVLNIAQKTMMVLLYPCLLSGYSVLTKLQAAEDVQVTGLFWRTCGAQQHHLAEKFCI